MLLAFWPVVRGQHEATASLYVQYTARAVPPDLDAGGSDDRYRHLYGTLCTGTLGSPAVLRVRLIWDLVV